MIKTRYWLIMATRVCGGPEKYEAVSVHICRLGSRRAPTDRDRNPRDAPPAVKPALTMTIPEATVADRTVADVHDTSAPPAHVGTLPVHRVIRAPYGYADGDRKSPSGDEAPISDLLFRVVPPRRAEKRDGFKVSPSFRSRAWDTATTYGSLPPRDPPGREGNGERCDGTRGFSPHGQNSRE